MKYRLRIAENKIKNFAANSKVVLVTGARQAGKSTLLKHAFPDHKTVVFDIYADLYGARRDPDLFLDNFLAPVILDEIQYAPELTSAIKRRVDETDKKGLYLLTGSQNLGVLNTIRESLAGRVLILNLHPMSYSETLGLGGKGCWISTYLKNPESLLTKKKISLESGNLLQHLWRGGLPGLLDLDDSLVQDYLRSYVETYILRDILTQENIQDRDKFVRFLGLCAALTGQEINHSQFGREVGISPKTVERWLHLLDRTYQWYELPPYHGNTIKRLSGKRKGHLNDTGLACHLQRISSPEALLVSPLLGSIFETWVFNEIKRQMIGLTSQPNMYHWRTTSGAEVDIILEIDGKYYPIETKFSSNLSRSDASGIRAFHETYQGKINIMTSLVIYAGRECYRLRENVIAIPWDLLLKDVEA